ncbi:cytosolic carboxypeptidase 1 isoform X2 [Anabrus simplex]|uniref:cytosolic carboxypeptidase 1 isoform X2 n=1 Tax=Anabrus simplex TaxID=316456 RepID=UPI0035A34721
MTEDSLNESLIDRLKQLSSKPNDNVEAIRSAAARLHSRSASQDRNIRERTLERIWRKNNGALPLIIGLLENVRDHLTACSLAGILHECVSPRSGKQRTPAVIQMIAMNTTQSLVKLVVQLQVKETHMADLLFHELICVLAQLAQKDPKFSIKTRLHGAVKSFHSLLRAHHNNTKMVYPLLLVIKALARSTSTATVLVKDGIVSTMEKVIISIGLSPSPKLRVALNVMHYLSKSRLCCTRIVKTGMLILLLRILERWERYDGRMRIRICNYTLVTLKHVCGSKLGRKSLRSQNGLQLLHKFCTSCPEDKCYDSLLSRVCSIINSCLEKKQLPVDGIVGPASFSLPIVSYSKSESDYSGRRTSSSRETSPASDDDTDEDIGDEDFDEDDEGSVKKKDQKDEKPLSFPAPLVRDLDDLSEYAKNFREMHLPENKNSTVRLSQKFTTRAKSFQDMNSYSDKYYDSETKKSDSGRSSPRDRNSLIHTNMVMSLSENSFQKKDHERSISDSHSDSLKKTGNSVICRENLGSRAFTEPLGNRLPNANERIVKGLTTLANIPSHVGFHYAYSVIASRVNSVLPFVKVAYPDMMGGDAAGFKEPLNIKDRRVCRSKLLCSVERGINPNAVWNRVVYDLDTAITEYVPPRTGDTNEKLLYNVDERHVGQAEPSTFHLMFESRFESGNLRKAIQIAPREYDLILMPDVNSTRHLQWFYFEVSNMEADVAYIFNIINCEKQNSQFNYGMKPIMYSVKDAVDGHGGWVRVGTDICYYRNSYQNPTGRGRSSYLTATFTITFPHAHDVCYIAYHYPYTYSQLLAQIWKWSLSVDPSEIHFRAECLCLSLNNNETPLLTITAPDSESNPISNRDIVFLTARVHPGESNASWVMQGTLDYLLGNTPRAGRLRNKFLFKIVPMLNMEGVINGCHRCGLTDEDLNRRWSRPNQYLHPVIYHTKGLLEYCVRVLKKPPFLFCDYHGHSRRKNVFLYGCSNAASWREADRSQPDDPMDYLLLPYLMEHFSRAFMLRLCDFRVERARESTARVTVWREFGIKRSYTMESSYCGCDQGYYQGHHLDTLNLKEVGANFCEALVCMKDESFLPSDFVPITESTLSIIFFPHNLKLDSHSRNKLSSSKGLHGWPEDLKSE